MRRDSDSNHSKQLDGNAEVREKHRFGFTRPPVEPPRSNYQQRRNRRRDNVGAGPGCSVMHHHKSDAPDFVVFEAWAFLLPASGDFPYPYPAFGVPSLEPVPFPAGVSGKVVSVCGHLETEVKGEPVEPAPWGKRRRGSKRNPQSICNLFACFAFP